MIANEILENKLINLYNKIYDIFVQNNTLKLNLGEDSIIQGLIQDVKSDNANSTYKKEIIVPYGTIKTGDYITHTFNGKNINYIVESAIDTEIGCDKAYLLECPYSIKIFGWNYTDILEYPIALKNNNAKLGVSESEIAITPNSSFDIILKYDIHTRSFVQSGNIINGIEHHKIQRVLIDKMAFSVTGVNHLISEGLLIISVENTNINPTDNLELGVADYTTYYREPPDYNTIIDTEIAKYQTSVTIPKTVLANEDVTSIVKRLKTGQISNKEVNVFVSSVDADNLLTLSDEIVTLTSQLPYESEDNTTIVTLTFKINNITKTLLVNVTIEKQDSVTLPDLIITADYDTIMGGDTNTYTINTDLPVYWSLINNEANLFTLQTSGTSNTCTVTAKYSVGDGDNATLVATVEGVDYTYEIIGESW